ncbi:MAG: 50S ribosomal protein L3 [Candidatus Terrybacteria bacterium RIFCSPHIGHO2_01_FULL_48_17]|uniref:Large ribosomal subunit protein uL3 n=1 Tax=Candidatus Terrybacteria bacterium RIFCSPHIGHO2_01_FULL_48_17 TaxID=1802362 RepID=A0A1G2PMR2_9BACT|nr:MAG: 50S ribosomal protein L3 [Candidatus Terrybacteria bacterium RIFCSPHIGHO2_01_FULL_48_17]OHA52845.1 MAG: 50S ribosomal protein L3 [Candidatus Terrybacteria bacterium RIFCSPLOWO2_01_FULL_48_14]
MKFLLGTKIGMSQTWKTDGGVVPLTVIQAGPMVVTQKKTSERDGYEAIQVSLGKRKRLKKPQQGHLKKGKTDTARWLREARGAWNVESGAVIDVSVFVPGDIVKVSGISKGKGFQGGVKRHGFHGASATHGTKHAHRQPGSIGSSWPERVRKGKRMAGRMGHERVTVKNLEVVSVDKEKNLLAVKGAVPGARGTLLEIRG